MWDDFWRFVADIGKRPTPHSRLNRYENKQPWGPSNFYWADFGDGESYAKKDKAEYQRQWRAKNPELTKNNELRKRFGISLAVYHEIDAAQGGVCAICQKPEPVYRHLPVDHCHATGKIRGLLCSHCNKAIGSFGDDVSVLQRAIDYLSRA